MLVERTHGSSMLGLPKGTATPIGRCEAKAIRKFTKSQPGGLDGVDVESDLLSSCNRDGAVFPALLHDGPEQECPEDVEGHAEEQRGAAGEYHGIDDGDSKR